MKSPRPPESSAPEITARPRSTAEELATRPVAEPGMSIDPEDLGMQFLRDATEQDNFESQQGGDTPELTVPGSAPSDEPLSGDAFEPDREIWESTVDLTLESGGSGRALAEASPAGNEQNQGLPYADEDTDLSGESVHQSSLFDREGEVLGEVTSPEIEADVNEPDLRPPRRTPRPSARRRS